MRYPTPILSLLTTVLLATAALAQTPASQPASHPPIGVKFTLDKPSLVTLVVEDSRGVRVRNLVSETPFPAGENTAWWDGLDDLARDADAASHAVYHVPGKLVSPGEYRIRGLIHQPLDILYQLTPYFPGDPPWMTADRSSGWLANHSPPSALCFLPAGEAPIRAGKKDSPAQMLIGSHTSEGGSGIAWIGLDGKKLHGQEWLGGVWTGAQYLARDTGDKRDPDVYAYTVAYWEGDKFNKFRSELRIHALRKKVDRAEAPNDVRFGTGEDLPLFKPPYKVEVKPEAQKKSKLAGFAARDGILVISIPANDQLLFINARDPRVSGSVIIDSPGGLSFDDAGRLWAVSGKTIVRFDAIPNFPLQPATKDAPSASVPAASYSPPKTIIKENLDEPHQLLVENNRIFVTDWGESHQVKLFSPEGKLERTIGDAGGTALGAYNPRRMHRPLGIALDNANRLWVAEEDFAPKRISIWTLDGKLERAFYGPPLYGAGGTLDPADRTRFFTGGMELRLNWDTGESIPTAIYATKKNDPLKPLRGDAYTSPERPLHARGNTYLTDAYNVSPIEGVPVASLWKIQDDGIARPVALVGQANEVWGFNPTRSFSARWKGQVKAAATGETTFYSLATHGTRLWVNGRPVIQNWRNWGGEASAKVALEAGKRYDITMEMYQNGGPARAELAWASPGGKREIIPTTALFTSDAPADAKSGNGLAAEYFADRSLGDVMENRIDPKVQFNWGKAGLTLKEDPGFRTRLPKGADLTKKSYFFAWSDLNDDGKVQPEEITTSEGGIGTVTLGSDLAVVGASGVVLRPARFTPGGAPVYDAAAALRLAPVGTAQPTASDGGGQALLDDAGNLVMTTAPRPFAAMSLGGIRTPRPLTQTTPTETASHPDTATTLEAPAGKRAPIDASWSYPSLWPGLHASHIAPLPDGPGMLIGTTRLLGPTFKPAGSQVGSLFAINGNKGVIYLMTADGLFVTTLFNDCRTASWNAPKAIPGMSVKKLSLNEECFYPSLTCTDDGQVYLQGGGRILKVTGLDTLRPLPESKITLTLAQLTEAQRFAIEEEERRQQAARAGAALEAKISLVAKPPTVDGKLDDWKDAPWMTIDERTVQVGDWQKRKVTTLASVRVDKDALFVAVKTDRTDLLKNSGEALQNLFKTGGGIDLMLGTDPAADPKRKTPAPGDVRLLVSQVGDKAVAMVYRPVAKGGTTPPVIFQSPVKTTQIDQVDTVEGVRVATTSSLDEKGAVKEACYELSIPLAAIGFKPADGTRIRADIGVLRGNGFQSMQRVYWSNKATGLMSDLAYEAELTPALWGTWIFQK